MAALERTGTAHHPAIALGRTVSTASTVADTLLEQREPSVSRRLTARERRVESVIAGLFLVAALPLAATDWGQWRHLPSAVLLVATYAFVARVRFQVGPGLVRPTQLVLVPMLFLLPALMVPLLVALGLVLSELPEIARRKAHPEREAALNDPDPAQRTVLAAVASALARRDWTGVLTPEDDFVAFIADVCEAKRR